jgi:hypothetical protein
MATEIKNINGLSVQQIQSMVQQGGKFVVFPYTISILVMTFKRSSDIYFIKPGEGTLGYSFPFVLLNLVLGWWGFPWGPIYTIGSMIDHFSGGKNITGDVLPHLIHNDPNANTSTYNVGGNTNQGNNASNTNSGGYNVPPAGGNTNQGSSTSNTNSGGYNVPPAGGNSGYNVPR